MGGKERAKKLLLLPQKKSIKKNPEISLFTSLHQGINQSIRNMPVFHAPNAHNAIIFED